MAVIPAVVTEDAKVFLPQMLGGLVTFKVIVSFKVGEGGWIDPGTGKEPRDPESDLRRLDNGLQDIDAIVDPTRAGVDQRYPSDSRGSFEKSLVLSDMSFVSPNKLEIRCLLDLADFNDDGNGNNPEIWEIGVFTDHPTVGGQKLMMAYGTFPQQVKTSGAPILNIVRIVF